MIFDIPIFAFLLTLFQTLFLLPLTPLIALACGLEGGCL